MHLQQRCTYPYYSAAGAGWKNAIRHTLSVNKAFLKQERPKDNPRNGRYWSIEQGKETLFSTGKPARKGNMLSQTVTQRNIYITSTREVHTDDY
jgi:hypothetical protein